MAAAERNQLLCDVEEPLLGGLQGFPSGFLLLPLVVVERPAAALRALGRFDGRQSDLEEGDVVPGVLLFFLGVVQRFYQGRWLL